jgi:hypothetical protein
MSLKKFNDQSEKPKFISKPNPLVPHSWQIFEFKDGKETYEPVGNYTLIETNEDAEITDKKMANLIRILNGKRDLMDLGNLTKKRVLFSIVLTLEKGVLHDS